jgi:hypothetical protein
MHEFIAKYALVNNYELNMTLNNKFADYTSQNRHLKCFSQAAVEQRLRIVGVNTNAS